jgi:GH24 family phage-related lysozyme (muramidase)
MKRDIGPHGLKLIKSFEGFVGFVYDDFGPLPYREWDGGHVRGTLSIGYGHTNAARNPLKISLGLRITEAQALAILHDDLQECVEQVNAAVRVPVSQGQFDALVSFTYNCGAGNLRRLIVPLNRGDYDRTRGDLGHYIRSKGQIMRGLERRRHAEQLLWDDDYGAIVHPTAEHGDDSPKDVDARPVQKTSPLTHGAAVIVGAGGAVEGLDTINTTLGTVKDTHDSLTTILAAISGDPGLWIAVAIVAGAAFLWWQHKEKTA